MLRSDWLIALEVDALAPNPTTGLHFAIIVVLGRAARVLGRARAFRLFRFLVQLFGEVVCERRVQLVIHEVGQWTARGPRCCGILRFLRLHGQKTPLSRTVRVDHYRLFATAACCLAARRCKMRFVWWSS